MKAILEFNLDDQDDEVAYTRCVKAKDMALALHRITEILRNWTKYKELSEETYDSISVIRDEVYQTLENHSLDIDDLII